MTPSEVPNEWTSGSDVFALQRFLEAQSTTFDIALGEIKARKKRTHWMWYIFPQLLDLGHSTRAVHYGIRGLDEARDYLAHPKLGLRLIECTLAMYDGPETDARQILGNIDAVKFQSWMTLFELADQQQSHFTCALRKFFGGVRHRQTAAVFDK